MERGIKRRIMMGLFKTKCERKGHDGGMLTLKDGGTIYNVEMCQECQHVISKTVDRTASTYMLDKFPEGYSTSKSRGDT